MYVDPGSFKADVNYAVFSDEIFKLGINLRLYLKKLFKIMVINSK